MSTVNELADTAAPLDALLIDAATGVRRRFVPDSSTARWAAALARRPRRTAGRLRDLGVEAVRIAAGTSTTTPDRRDRRFTDVAWSENPFLRRTVQLYLAAGSTADQLVEDAQLGWRDEQRTRFLVDNVTEALAPSNLPLVNPASAKAVIDTAGLSLVRGGTQLVKDMATSPRIPEMVDKTGFELGTNIAATPGSVVLRTEVFELIQYAPQAEEVHDVPIMIVPPTINKFYAVDLAPDRSLVEHSVRQGRQMFVMSWRNPDARHAEWNFETYVSAIIEALDAVEHITGSSRTALAGICSGGILASITAAYLAATGKQDRLAALILAVTVIDNYRSGTVSAIVGRRMAEKAKAMSRRKGYLDGRALAEVFAWLRPGDLIWNYWVNNYLLGKKPPAFDILFWNADTTRMTAGLHADFVDLSTGNALVTPGALKVFGVPIDLGAVTIDSYIAAGIADHITPWTNCYRTTQLLGGKTRFVLSTNGHIAALVNPPGNPKASYYTNKENPAQADDWLKSAETHKGTWWDDVSEWLNDRSGPRRPAPAELGAHPACPRWSTRPVPTSSTTEGRRQCVRVSRPQERQGPMSEQIRRVRVRGLDLRVSVRPGSESGPPLLLCNGIGASFDLLQPFVDEVDRRVEVVRFDVPGVGGSSPSPVPYTFPAMAWLVGKLMTELGYDAFDVLGISWGGALAQQLAFQNPRRCRRLVLVSTATGALMVPANPWVLRKMITPRRYRDPEYATSIAAELYGGRMRDEPDLARRLLHDQSRVGARRGYLMQLLAGVGWTSLPVLPLIRQPTLVLAGNDDPIIPLVNARIMQRLLPHATLHVYDDGHLGLVTRADRLGPIVSEFVLASGTS